MTVLIPLLLDAIRECLAPDHYGRSNRTGICLSGGLDSSTVASLAPARLPTITGYYDVPGFDERTYARHVAHEDHTEVEITPEDFVHWFDDFARYCEPGWGTGAFGQYMVAKRASEIGLTVLLSGEASDELFGGYARQMLVAGEQPPRGYEHYQLPDGYPLTLEKALAYDYERLPALLAVDDAMCAAWGIEARAPFNDPRIHRYALNLPAGYRVGKRHLRAAVRGIVPDTIIDRTDKMGFPTPFVLWAQAEPVRSFVEARIGYVPDVTKPFDRTWWKDLLTMAKTTAPA